jgi:hypothetical protein
MYTILTAIIFVIVSYLLSVIYKTYEPTRVQTIIVFIIGILYLFSPLLPVIAARISITSFLPVSGGYLLLLAIIYFNRTKRKISY